MPVYYALGDALVTEDATPNPLHPRYRLRTLQKGGSK